MSYILNLKKQIKVEEIITMIQALKALIDKDTQAYKALMDSAYGSPAKDITTGGNQINPINITVANKKTIGRVERLINESMLN